MQAVRLRRTKAKIVSFLRSLFFLMLQLCPPGKLSTIRSWTDAWHYRKRGKAAMKLPFLEIPAIASLKPRRSTLGATASREQCLRSRFAKWNIVVAGVFAHGDPPPSWFRPPVQLGFHSVPYLHGVLISPLPCPETSTYPRV